MRIWAEEWRKMDIVQQAAVDDELDKAITIISGDHTGEDLVADGVSPILYIRALGELAEKKYKESPQEYDEWYSLQSERFESFVEAYRKKLDLPPMYPKIEMFADVKVHEGIAT
ncbi:uncharacterized protein PHALS_08165 [Plasmopara halstedii]|uniref:Uncharacterized protein n=1 Tax=Plasmopara halstedii TaxID=4781 RepID=A0A0P1AB58_PLAHL|nr:uncharacterized protein PHALS_08165 [Plasmopara halstedii]CEG38069.1 hypothetical protein PHALS_08165 [Plasmopara halstedii]|eukprot:XP_024574438.1 hypothetical protein PHALS_08165 [Plasmopara halstedii]